MVVIRLTRVGKKNSPAYRVVVAEKRRAVKRKFIEIIGHYNPMKKPKEVVILSERALFWMKKGAKPSDTVRNLMADLEIIAKKDKVNVKYARSKKKKELKAETSDKAKVEKKPIMEEIKEEIKDEKTIEADKGEPEQPEIKETEENKENSDEKEVKVESAEKPKEDKKE